STVGRAPTGGTGNVGVEATTFGAAGETSRVLSFFSGSLGETGTATVGVSGRVVDGFSGFSTVGTAGFGVGVEGGGVTPTAAGGGGVIVSGGVPIGSVEDGAGGVIGAGLVGGSSVAGAFLPPSAGAAEDGGRGGSTAGDGEAVVEGPLSSRLLFPLSFFRSF